MAILFFQNQSMAVSLLIIADLRIKKKVSNPVHRNEESPCSSSQTCGGSLQTLILWNWRPHFLISGQLLPTSPNPTQCRTRLTFPKYLLGDAYLFTLCPPSTKNAKPTPYPGITGRAAPHSFLCLLYALIRPEGCANICFWVVNITETMGGGSFVF